MRDFQSLPVIAVVALVLFLPKTSTAQFNPLGGPTPPADQRQDVRGSGKIKGAMNDVIHVANDDGDQWLVKVPTEPRNVRLMGAANSGFLKPGMMVRFTGTFDSKGVPQAPINEVEVFTYFPPRPGQRPRANQEQPRLGVFPNQGLNAAELFGDVDKEQPKNQVASFHVAGQVRGFRDNRLTVAAGPTVVNAVVDADAEVTVETADLRWMRIGDTVEFEGWTFPRMKSQVFANRLRVKAHDKLGAAVAKPEAAGKQNSEKAAEDADPPLPF